jgi:hypothetical protein
MARSKARQRFGVRLSFWRFAWHDKKFFARTFIHLIPATLAEFHESL